MRHLIYALFVLGGCATNVPAETLANPLGMFYNQSYENFELYEHPGALLVAGNCNRYDEHFADARAKGAEVLAYLNAIEGYDKVPFKLNETYYMNGRENVPLWPFPTYGVRVNWPKTHLADMRVGSKWVDNVVNFVVHLMK